MPPHRKRRRPSTSKKTNEPLSIEIVNSKLDANLEKKTILKTEKKLLADALQRYGQQSAQSSSSMTYDEVNEKKRKEARLRTVQNMLHKNYQKKTKLLGEKQRLEVALDEPQSARSDLVADRDAVQSLSLARPHEQQPASTGTILASSDLDNHDFPWSRKLMSVLKDIFGLSELRPLQLPTINALMNRQDCLLIIPTGGGKSLCFQLPALLVDGVTVVVSPLVSLMEDQVIGLKRRGVQAEMLSASVTYPEQKAILNAMTDSSSKMKILYVAPERLKSSRLLKTSLKKIHAMGRLAHFVVDEVHCCSQWGHDFRKDYQVLGTLKAQFPDVPILGLTATATTAITVDVKKMLHIEKCLEFRASFNRHNLTYKVMTKTSSGKENVAELAKLIRSKYDGQSGIVYCLSKKDCEIVAQTLCTHGIKARFYHSDVASEDRSKVHLEWKANKCQVVVATTAFGMGIDKPDVRFVINYSMSQSIENFYQESGRAGRDGNPADCIVFFRLGDISRWSSIMNNPNKEQEEEGMVDKPGLPNFYSMVAFCIELKRCRRAVLADHFSERWDSSMCDQKCDNCNVLLAEGGSSTWTTEMTDVTEHFVALHEIIKDASKIKKALTAIQLIDAWLGKGSFKNLRPKIPSPNLPRTECERLLAGLLVQGYFEQTFAENTYWSHIIAGTRASEVLVAKAKIMMEMATSTRKAAPPKAMPPAENRSKSSTGRVASCIIDLTKSSSDDEPIGQLPIPMADKNQDKDVFGESSTSSAAGPISKRKSEAVTEKEKCQGLNVSSTSVSSRAGNDGNDRNEPKDPPATKFVFKKISDKTKIQQASLLAKRRKL